MHAADILPNERIVEAVLKKWKAKDLGNGYFSNPLSGKSFEEVQRMAADQGLLSINPDNVLDALDELGDTLTINEVLEIIGKGSLSEIDKFDLSWTVETIFSRLRLIELEHQEGESSLTSRWSKTKGLKLLTAKKMFIEILKGMGKVVTRRRSAAAIIRTSSNHKGSCIGSNRPGISRLGADSYHPIRIKTGLSTGRPACPFRSRRHQISEYLQWTCR